MGKRKATLADEYDYGGDERMEAWALAEQAEEMPHPKCDCGCGDDATVRFELVGLCDDCAADTIRDALKDSVGAVCGNIARDAEGNLTCCLTTYGVEHFHG